MMKNEQYAEKHLRSEHKQLRRPKRLATLLVSLLLVLGVAVGGTVAFLSTRTDSKVNTFTPSEVTCEVTETFENNVKSQVAVQNTGDTTAFIRAAINVTWMKDAEAGTENQTVSAKVPLKDKDYSITFAKNTNWIKGADGYYYYQLPVDPQVSTGELIKECKLQENASVPDGYHLSVEIVASAIQSAPDSVVQSMWHVTVEDGKITSANGSEVTGE